MDAETVTGTEPQFVLDPASPDVHADGERLRELGPLVRVEMEGVVAWAATQLATLAAALAHPDLSRSIRYWDPAVRATVRDGTAVRRITFDTSMLNAEGEQHRRLRGPLARVFTARRVEELRPWVARLAAERVEFLASLPPGPVDLREHFAFPLPRDVITELMGIPHEMRPQVNELTDVAAGVGDTPVDVTEARKTLYGLIGEIIERLRETPGPGLISALVQQGELTGKQLQDTV